MVQIRVRGLGIPGSTSVGNGGNPDFNLGTSCSVQFNLLVIYVFLPLFFVKSYGQSDYSKTDSIKLWNFE